MKNFDLKLKITAKDEADAKLIGDLLNNLTCEVPYEVQLKLAQKAKANPKAIAKVLANPLVKAAIK